MERKVVFLWRNLDKAFTGDDEDIDREAHRLMETEGLGSIEVRPFADFVRGRTAHIAALMAEDLEAAR